ncbi:MAG: aminodeoxychorismate/anthranilate synthase component II [Propionibacteriaceae bacterium]|jgi:anthranilate synthase component 2|nr:aminodeoxychorismate/anthranilate synthase component II [Propionibacteriaceae bacterium]
MIVLIDNYDSFTYNVSQALGTLALERAGEGGEPEEVRVVRNDALTVDDLAALRPSHIVISPGPGRPEDAGICVEAIQRLHADIPILGICLGHQAIVEAFGGVVGYAHQLMHGKPSEVTLTGQSPLFVGLPPVVTAARYHSLAAEAATFPLNLRVTGLTADGEIMALEHETSPCFGVQFHPESIMTPDGARMIANFLEIEGPDPSPAPRPGSSETTSPGPRSTAPSARRA